MSAKYEYEMKIASFPRQILILMWKNLIIFKCNLVGTVLEMLSPFLFLSFLLIIRYYIERIRFSSDMFNMPTNVYDISFYLANQSRNLIVYYPNNSLIRNLVTNAIDVLKFQNPGFDPLGILLLFTFNLN
jgi:hypothetical protein